MLLLDSMSEHHIPTGSKLVSLSAEAKPSVFDNIDGVLNEGPAQSETDESVRLVLLPPEKRRPVLPSTHFPEDHPLRKAELNCRIAQATRYLAATREAIAEKSFQYSHVMRAAPTNAVRTRSRSAILSINQRIGHCCHVYERSRAAMVKLCASEATLKTFRLLSRDDVKASTAILKPNMPGASSIRLSWIWNVGSSDIGSSEETMRECKCGLLLNRIRFILYSPASPLVACTFTNE